jgi:DNA-binding transcriptional MerR regulator
MSMAKVQPKVKKLYYSIGEVSEITKLKAYVLRYWETEFAKLKPPKNRAGNRTYRQKDIDMILNIKDLLYNKKFTIDGARSVISGKASAPEMSMNVQSFNDKQLAIVRKIKDDLTAILKIITD